MSSLAILLAVIVIQTIDSVNAHDKCADYLTEHSSEFPITCDGGKVIIVESAIIGESDQYKANDTMHHPSECPINSTCTKEIMFPAEICTGRNSCNISQRQQLPYDESDPLCPRSNYIGINYSCITPVPSIYGDICHFDGIIYGNSSVYISSYPNFPNDMDGNSAFRCHCMLTRNSESSGDVSVRALLVKLSANNACSENLTIDSGDENERTFCSPSMSVNNITTVSLSPNRSALIAFERGSSTNQNNGKFLLEITASKDSSTLGQIKCGFSESTFSTSPTVTSPSPLYNISSTTTSNLVNSTSKRDPINLSGATLRLNIRSVSTQKKTSSSKSREASSKSTSEDFETNTVPLTSSSVYFMNASLSTGAIIGIVLGLFGFLTLIVIIVIILLCRSRKRQQRVEYNKGMTDAKVQKSLTAIQNTQTINNIEIHEVVSPVPQTFQPEAHFSNNRHTKDYDNFCPAEGSSLSNYEESVPVSVALYGPDKGGPDKDGRQERDEKNKTGPATETQYTEEESDLTVIDNPLYGKNENPLSYPMASNDYDFAREVAQEKSVEAIRGYEVVEMKNSPEDHSHFSALSGNETAQPLVGVNAEAKKSSGYEKIEEANPMSTVDSEVVVIDNTLYGSMLPF